jgi:hypothetical protein
MHDCLTSKQGNDRTVTDDCLTSKQGNDHMVTSTLTLGKIIVLRRQTREPLKKEKKKKKREVTRDFHVSTFHTVPFKTENNCNPEKPSKDFNFPST